MLQSLSQALVARSGCPQSSTLPVMSTILTPYDPAYSTSIFASHFASKVRPSTAAFANCVHPMLMSCHLVCVIDIAPRLDHFYPPVEIAVLDDRIEVGSCNPESTALRELAKLEVVRMAVSQVQARL